MAGMPDARARNGGQSPRAPQKNPVGEKAAEQLRAIAADAPAPEDAIEPALRTVLEAVGATAGAICLFDQRQELLRLAAEVGLSDEGCRQLRSVRRGGVGTWDMPLHSLLNRRAYLIESAARNRYVPPLVEPASSVRTLACIPLYAGSTALASLVLVAVTPQSFGEREIRVLDPALRELITIIESVRRRAPGGGGDRHDDAPSPAPAAPPPPPMPASARRPQRATLSPERSTEPPVDAAPERTATASRPVDVPSGPPPEAALGDDGLSARLAESERDRVRLAAALEKAAAERAADVTRLMTRLLDAESAGGRQTGTSPREGAEDLRRALEAAELAETARATAAVEAEAARVEATRARSEIQRLQAAEREFGEERARLERALAELQGRIDGAAADRAPLDEALAAANARAEAAAAEAAALQRERDAVAAERDRLREAAESAGDADTARADLAQAQAQLATLAPEVERLRAEAEASAAAAEAARSAQAESQAQATSALADAEAARARVGDLESELVGTRAERDRVVAEADGLRAAAARAEELPVVRAELDATRAAAEALQSEADRLRADAERLTGALAQAEAAVAETRGAHEAALAALRAEHDAALDALRGEHATALATVRGEHDAALAALRAEHEGSLATVRAEHEAAATAARGQLDAFAAQVEELIAERERLAAEAEAAQQAAVAAAEEGGRQALETLRAELTAALDALRADRDAAQGAMDALRCERDTAQAAHDALQSRVDELARERDELRAATATLTAERDAHAAARADLDATLRTARAEATATLHAERARFAAELAAAGGGVTPPLTERLTPPAADEDLGELLAPLDVVPDTTTDAAPEEAAPPSPEITAEILAEPPLDLESDTPAAEPPAPFPVVASGPLPPPGPEVVTRTVVLDDDLTPWDDVKSGEDRELCTRCPAPDTVAEVLVLSPARVLANLARPGVLDQLLRLRAAGYAGRLHGYLAAPASRTVLPLAAIEPGSRPLDPDAVIASLGMHAGQGTRVVMVGADVDALISVRQALARQGMSVSMAWNAKQADDLIGMVRPQVVVVDLDLPGRDGYGIVARLAGMAVVPAALLIVGADDPAPRLGALLGDPALAERQQPRDAYWKAVLADKRAAPEKKRNVRALR